MGQTIQSGMTSITGNVSATVIPFAPTYTIKTVSVNATNNQTGNILTVDEGDEAYILGFTMSGQSDNGGYVAILNDGTQTVGLLRVNIDTAGTKTMSNLNVQFPVGYAVKVAASKSLTWSSQVTSGTCSIVVYYILLSDIGV